MEKIPWPQCILDYARNPYQEARKMERSAFKLAAFLIAVVVAFTMQDAFAIQRQKKSLSVTSSRPQLPNDPNTLTKTFLDNGVISCAQRINQVTTFLGSGGSSGAFLFIPPDKTDKRLLSASLETVDKDQRSVYSSASFAPTQNNGCGVVYDAVAWWPMACEKVASKQFGGQKNAGILKQNIANLELGPASRVFLMPTKDGCISIKKEVVFQ